MADRTQPVMRTFLRKENPAALGVSDTFYLLLI
jgi:hypothetical protein